MIRAGITNPKINNSKYLSIIDGGSDDDVGDDDCDVDAVVVLAALWILNPKINDDVATKPSTRVRRFCVIAGTIIIGAPRLVRFCSVTALLSSMHIDDRDNSMINVNNNVIK
ncbi:MAG TPA: hypothetical protein VEH06_08835 [Candidatus Bathyarchaeia archaeon]|nr:hypothetical protein [Candidatus Bathyarchaeia archaeon]